VTTIPSPVTAAAGGWQSIGTSVNRRPLRLKRHGTGPRKILWIGGIHGNEPEGTVATQALSGSFEQAHMAPSVSLLILEDANPDGRAAHTRANAHGVDLNRNFPSRNFDASDPRYGGHPLSQPESRALYDLIISERPQLVIACHSWPGRAFINFDGPAQRLALEFSRQSGLPLKASSTLGEATPGSLGSWLGHDLGVSVLTIEWARNSDPNTDWRMTRRAILSALTG
jgi:protein MpaA